MLGWTPILNIAGGTEVSGCFPVGRRNRPHEQFLSLTALRAALHAAMGAGRCSAGRCRRARHVSRSAAAADLRPGAAARRSRRPDHSGTSQQPMAFRPQASLFRIFCTCTMRGRWWPLRWCSATIGQGAVRLSRHLPGELCRVRHDHRPAQSSLRSHAAPFVQLLSQARHGNDSLHADQRRGSGADCAQFGDRRISAAVLHLRGGTGLCHSAGRAISAGRSCCSFRW